MFQLQKKKNRLGINYLYISVFIFLWRQITQGTRLIETRKDYYYYFLMTRKGSDRDPATTLQN